jgi:hypothetical protein
VGLVHKSVSGVPAPLLNWDNEASGWGHAPRTSVPGVPALSNSLSRCPVAKSGCNTLRLPPVTPACYSRSLPLATCH